MLIHLISVNNDSNKYRENVIGEWIKVQHSGTLQATGMSHCSKVCENPKTLLPSCVCGPTLQGQLLTPSKSITLSLFLFLHRPDF